MNCDKGSIKEYLYNKAKTSYPDIILDNIIAYYKNNLFFTYGENGLADSEVVISEIDELIIFKEFDNKNYILKELELVSKYGYEVIENVSVDVLYMYKYHLDSVNVFFYYPNRDIFTFSYYTKNEFNNMFIPDYTNDNFNLIDGIK